jgi:fused signal recognition particle receptor
MLEEVEAVLIGSDLGVHTTGRLIASVKEELQGGQEISEELFQDILKRKIVEILEDGAGLTQAIVPTRQSDGPYVVMVVGINGVGKTTTVAKLANQFKEAGLQVMMAAADTFRAAAVEQLTLWGQNIGVPVISGPADAKPATVVFDAMVEAKKQCVDLLLIDTAGRLHTKTNLMQELQGVTNSIKRHQGAAPHETILVVDGSTGQNAISQAREFNAAVPLSGIVVTKLDGTPKGGVVVAIKEELRIPIRYIGVGEAKEDLRPFVAREFVEALFDGGDLGADEAEKVSAHAETRRRKRGA